jgi:hypothetical protein
VREKNRSSAGLGLVLPLGPFDDSSFKSMIVILGVFAHDDGSCRSLYFFPGIFACDDNGYGSLYFSTVRNDGIKL